MAARGEVHWLEVEDGKRRPVLVERVVVLGHDRMLEVCAALRCATGPSA